MELAQKGTIQHGLNFWLSFCSIWNRFMLLDSFIAVKIHISEMPASLWEHMGFLKVSVALQQ